MDEGSHHSFAQITRLSIYRNHERRTSDYPKKLPLTK
jgi:hypothetical protein